MQSSTMKSLRTRSNVGSTQIRERIHKVFRRQTNEQSSCCAMSRKSSCVGGTTLLVGELKEDSSVEVSLVNVNDVLLDDDVMVGQVQGGCPELYKECPSLEQTDCSSGSSTSSFSNQWEASFPPFQSSDVPQADEQQLVDEGTNQPVAGSSTKRFDNLVSKHEMAEEPLIGWRRIPGSTIRVRSETYLQNRRKVPSSGELYECLHVDFLQSNGRIPDISGRVQIPGLQEPNQNQPWNAPDVFVVSICLPAAPSLLKDDGPSYTITMYFGMKPETRDILKQIYSEHTDSDAAAKANPCFNAVRLFEQWCNRAKDDPSFMGRFKLITSADNAEDLGLPSWISRWNGKPILIKRSGTTGFLHQHPNCLEMEISLHPFPWATKKAIQYLMSSLSLLLTFGFVIEAREYSELPEVLLGLCQLCYPQAEKAIPSDEFFG